MLAEGASANTDSRCIMKLKKYCNREFHFISPGTEKKRHPPTEFSVGLFCFVSSKLFKPHKTEGNYAHMYNTVAVPEFLEAAAHTEPSGVRFSGEPGYPYACHFFWRVLDSTKLDKVRVNV